VHEPAEGFHTYGIAVAVNTGTGTWALNCIAQSRI
jgi:hypothetical protein